VRVNIRYWKLLLFYLLLSNVNFEYSVSAQSDIPELPNFDNKIYFGYDYGATGIIDALTKIINIYPNLSPTIGILINDSLNKVWESRVSVNSTKYSVWFKNTSSSGTAIYPGKKYGVVGILETFLNYHQIENNQNWLSKVEEAYWYLNSIAIQYQTLPHWPYTINPEPQTNGISITDIKFGSAGVLQLSSKLFNITNNQMYITQGNKIVSWLESISHSVSIDGLTTKLIPWYQQGNNDSGEEFFTGYGTGISGIASSLYEFGKLTNNISITNWAVDMIRLLIKIQEEDGSWFENYDLNDTNSDGIITKNEIYPSYQTKLTGYDNGISGILKSIAQINRDLDINSFNTSILNGIQYLFSQRVANSTHRGFFVANDNKKMLNSFDSGTLGIIDTLFELKTYLNQEQYNKIINSYVWLLTEQSLIFSPSTTDYFLMQQTPNNLDYFDLSIAEGLAGVLLSLSKQNIRVQLSEFVPIDEIIISTLNSLMLFRNSNLLWQRQIVIQNLNDFYRYSGSYLPEELTDNIIGNPISPLIWSVLIILLIIPLYVLKKKVRKYDTK